MENTNLQLSFLSAAGMMFVAIAAVLSWPLKSGHLFRWFCIGAALWFVAVVIKFIPISLVNDFLSLPRNQLALLPGALVSIPILCWCDTNWGVLQRNPPPFTPEPLST